MKGCLHVFAALFLVTVLLGCATTKTAGVNDPTLQSTSPWRFHYEGTEAQARSEIKRLLASHGWAITEYDGSAGLVQARKVLSEDERWSLTPTAIALAGVAAHEQEGTLTFLFDRAGSPSAVDSAAAGVEVEMASRLQQYLQTGSALRSRSDQVESAVAQGHPLPMKYKALLESRGFLIRK